MAHSGRFRRFVGHAGAGVVGHQAPALRGLDVDVGGQHEGGLRRLRAGMCTRSTRWCTATPRLSSAAHLLGARPDAAVAEDRLEAGAIAAAPTTRGPPGCTQTISSSSAQTAIRRSRSPLLQRFVELRLDVVGTGQQGGGAGFGLRHARDCRDAGAPGPRVAMVSPRATAG
jgi:hypothetical protein